ncbi:winged helix-turn-helix domain-containing protein [Lysobacter niabensis]|uniref:winged helix-turn-helix domain-containing protein n=1 Tax=Agrilutibacter niabensis TaxID=380628 RepID=UPI003623D36E
MNSVAAEDFPRYRFEDYVLDTRSRELRDAAGKEIPLTAKAFDTLEMLVANRHRLVGKDELLATVWAGRVVEENNLTQAISTLRRALGSAGGEHRYIVTVPGRGYRFVAEVHEGAVAANAPATGKVPGAQHTRRALALGALLFALGLFAVTASRLYSTPAAPPPSQPATATLAVLPFRSLSPGPRDELLELGLAETLVTRLGHVRGLSMRSLDASQRFDDPVEAGRQLGVAYVVAGSTQRSGERVRVNARLLAVPGGRTLWAGTFDEQRDRVFTLQDALASAVGGALALKVGTAGPRRSPCEGGDAESYRAYLNGRYVLGRLSARRLPEAYAALRRAIELDPACARAYATLASLHVQQIGIADADPREQLPPARTALARALALDPQSAEAWRVKAEIEAYEWNTTAAEASFRRSLALDPDAADTHAAYADLLVGLGREQDTGVHIWRAHELDPLSPTITLMASGWVGFSDPPAGQALGARVLEQEPDYWGALFQRGAWARQQGRLAESISDLERAVENSSRNSRVVASLARSYVAAGQVERARALLAELQERDRVSYVHPSSLAIVYYELGEDEHALDLLERAYAERDGRIFNLGADPYWKRLHAQPRFQALAQRAGLRGGTTHSSQ